MIILGIETSTVVSSAALWRDGEIVAAAEEEGRRHLEFLMPAVVDLLARAAVPIHDLDGIGVGLGPGRFTGMRAGIATAKALALAEQVPLAGIPSLDVVAWPVRDHEGPICATIEAKRDQIFAAFYRGTDRVGEYLSLASQDLVLEEGTMRVGSGMDGAQTFPSAEHLCEMAARRIGSGDTIPIVQIEPLYVRKSDAEINWEARGVTIERPMRVKPSKHVVDAAGGDTA